MREIKFRVYDHKQGMMFEVDQLEAMLQMKSQNNLENGIVYGSTHAKKDLYYTTGGHLSKNTMDKNTGKQVKRFNLMQFTGLTDEDGKEIYEGDIIRVFGTDELGVTEVDIDENCIVKWDDFSAGFYSDCIHKRTIILEIDVENSYEFDAFPLFQSHNEMMFDFEVVGNIHENPELLGECHEG